MNAHTDVYINLMNQADRLHSEWNSLLDRTLLQREYERIDETEYYRLMGEVTGLQNKYVELRDQAIDADHIYWLGCNEEETHAEYRQRIHDETPN